MIKKLFFCVLIIAVSMFGCTKNPTEPELANNMPEIIRLSANPTAIGMDQIITLSVLAADEDDDNIKYEWITNGGRYIHGNKRKFAKWRAPKALGNYLCTVRVSDGKDTIEDSVWVNVVKVPLLQLSTNAIEFSYNTNSTSLSISKSGEPELSWRIKSGKSWIDVYPDSGTTNAETDQVTISIDRTNRSVGYYCGSIMVESNGGNQGVKIEMAVPQKQVMLQVPAGEFYMGSEIGREDEQPIHRVHLDEFYIDKYEVTNAQYADFLNNTKENHLISASSNGASQYGRTLISLRNEYKDGWNLMCPINYINNKFVVSSLEVNTPVRFVTWYGAKAFADYYGKRLPTEAEWEKAAKGTDKRLYPWGDSDPTQWYCNYKDEVGHAVMVGNYHPLGRSPYGCCDMAGNVWEWCSSKYKEYPYETEDGRENLSGSDYRIIRGGSWATHSETLRCAARCYCEPDMLDPYFGFRCVK
jgi:formylglycine-generating enzyme required for sulfatase activity